MKLVFGELLDSDLVSVHGLDTNSLDDQFPIFFEKSWKSDALDERHVFVEFLNGLSDFTGNISGFLMIVIKSLGE